MLEFDETQVLFLVDDNPAERFGIRELLGQDDIDVVVAATGADALERVATESFDCAVLDLRLPDMSGFDTSRTLAEHSRGERFAGCRLHR